MPDPTQPSDEPIRHPTLEKLVRAFRPGSRPEQRRTVIRHLLACTECCQLAALKLGSKPSKPSQPSNRSHTVSNSSQPVVSQASHDRVLSAALELRDRLQLERADVPRLWSELQPLSPNGRKLKAENSPRYYTWAFYSFVLEGSRLTVVEDARQGLAMADLALTIARSLSWSMYGGERVREAEAEALIERGNAQRIIEKFPAAFRSLDDAISIIGEDGPLDPLAGARYSSIRASLLRDVGDFEGAIADISRACRVYVRTGETVLYGRALLTQAYILRWINPEQGYATARQALQYIPRADNLNRVIARHTCCDNLCEAGRYHEAWMQYRRAFAMVQRGFADNPRIYLSYRWLAARIDKGIAFSGENPEDFYACAEMTLGEVWEGYASRPDSMQEVALVALDLVEVYMNTHRIDNAIATAQEAFQLLQAQRLPLFTLQAFITLQEAIDKRCADQILLRQTREVLARYWRVGKGETSANGV